MEGMSERELCNLIVGTLQARGCMVWREQAGMMPIEGRTGRRMIRMAPAGTADIIGLTKTGQFIAVEVKLPDRRKNVTEAQALFLSEVRRKGGLAGVATAPNEALLILEGHQV